MPLENQLHVDQLLGQISVKYRNQSYIAGDLFPEVPVKKSSDLFRVYERNFRLPESQRSTKAEAKEWTFNVSNSSYLLQRHALKDYVSDGDADNYDLADLRAETTEELTDAILRRAERDFAVLVTTTSWSLNLSLTSTNAWNATTTVDPVAQFDTGTATVVLNSGQKPNKAGMGLESWFALKNNAQVLDRVKYTSSEVSENMVAKLIGADKIAVSGQAIDTANEGASGGASISALWSDRVLWVYTPPSAGPLKVSGGYTFKKAMPLVKRWREEPRESDAIEVNMEYQHRVVASLAGFIIADVT